MNRTHNSTRTQNSTLPATLRLPVAVAMSSVLAAAGLVAFTPRADAALVTRCIGEGGNVTVPGDLVVPAGQSCWLDGTTVQGNVKVRKNADLVADGATFQGRVHAGKNGYVDVTDTDISGNVGANNGYGTYLETSTVHGAVNARNTGTDYDGFVYVVDTQVSKRLHARVPGEVVLDGSQVSGPVTGDGTRYTDVHNSTLQRKLSVTSNAKGGTFCDSEVYGNVGYSGNQGPLQVGADGPVTACDGVSFFGGNVNISDNTGGVRVSDTIIAGDLSGTGNDPAPQGANNRVRGAMSGQFKNLPAPSAEGNKKSGRTMAKHAIQNRDATAKHKAGSRRAHAKAQAKAAGRAQL